MISCRKFGTYFWVALVIGLNAILISGLESRIKLVNVVFRHGDRAPEEGHEMYPNDPYLNYSFFPEGLGQLTNRGKMREYELGRALNERYISFLGDLYLPKLVVARSTNFDRTKMSLQLVLAGLFPPVNLQQQWNPHLIWQPIPATYEPYADGNLMSPDQCPLYRKEYNRVLKLPEAQERIASLKDAMTKLTDLTGKEMKEPVDLFRLYHTFMAESSANLTLPEWAYDYFPDGELFDAAVLTYNLLSFTPKLKRLYGGVLVRSMLENMLNIRKPDLSNTKIYLYSGHETNVAALLHTFDVYKPHAPAYSSAIILELLQQDDKDYAKLVYYRGIPPVFQELKIPGCEILCPLDKFKELTKNVIPSDEEMKCK